MAAKSKLGQQISGFDVTCVIGRVEFGTGEKTPFQAAMEIVSRHVEDTGAFDVEFSFPHESGGTIHASINFEAPEESQKAEEYDPKAYTR
jgi:hypothetical protein